MLLTTGLLGFSSTVTTLALRTSRRTLSVALAFLTGLGFLNLFSHLATPASAVAADKQKQSKKGSNPTVKNDPNASVWLKDYEKESKALGVALQQLPGTEMPQRVIGQPMRSDLLRNEILRRVKPQELARFLKSPEEQQFLEKFLSQSDWMEDFVGSGPLENPLTAVLSLAAIYLKDPEIGRPGLKCRIATSSALETAMALRTPENAVKIYEYYRDRNSAKLLHPGFPELAVWEMRFAVGAKFDVDDLVWIGNRSNFAAPEAVNAAWQVEYLGYNPFGMSVQSDWYYRPWIGRLNYSQRMVRVGGVCGSLSTTGAMSAMAYGIPATTMGEPGHCAYAVRPKPGQWMDGNSVDGNDRGPHRNYFYQNWADLFAGDEAWQNPGLRTSQGLAWAAHALPGDAGTARAALLDQAIAANPIHAGHWKERLELAKKAKSPQEWWPAKAEVIVSTFAKYPQQSWELLKVMPLDELPAATRTQIQRIWLKGCSTPTAGMIKLFPTDRILAAMYAQRGSGDPKSLFADVLELTLKNPLLLPRFFQGCSHLAGQIKDKGANEQLLAVIIDLADKLAKTGPKPKKGKQPLENDALKSLCLEGILAAEKTGDKRAFNSFATLGARYVQAKYPQNHKPYPGEMLSLGGVLRLSTSSSEYDEPLAHGGILNGKGGFFHTDAEAKPSVTIELGKQGTLSGIAIINRENNTERAVPLKVSVSMDGKKWTPVFQTAKSEAVWQIDLGSKRPTAKFVKVEGDYKEGRDDILHLHGIFVYGQRTE